MNSATRINLKTSPLRGEVGAQAPGGGGAAEGCRQKPYTAATQNHAKKLRHNLTDAEQKLWQLLRNSQTGIKFRRQQPIGPYIVDFISFDAKLIIELDGGQHNGSTRDAIRTEFFEAEGFAVLRFWNNEVLENMEAVFDVITRRIGHPHLTSPLKGEELPCGGDR